jgi:hypothetical protein
MSQTKAKVSIQRADDFQEMDSLLSEAIAMLDDRNAKVGALLLSEALPNPEQSLLVDDSEAAPAPEDGGEPPAATEA